MTGHYLKDSEQVAVKDVVAWLRQESRGTVTPHVRRVLLRLAKQAEDGTALIGGDA